MFSLRWQKGNCTLSKESIIYFGDRGFRYKDIVDMQDEAGKCCQMHYSAGNNTKYLGCIYKE